MILKAGINKGFSLLLFLIVFSSAYAQISSGRIVYERRTNLQKRMGDNPRMKNFINEQNKYRNEKFELFFNDSMCVFRPIEEEDASAQGWMRYMTTRNTVYQNINKREKCIILDLWGTEAILKDTLDKRQWKITDSKRNIAGYQCRRAIWQPNDTTRLYAWFTTEIVPSVGPEGFEGLPGTILGMATEDGSVVYFAKEVKAMTPPAGVLIYNIKNKEIYTEEKLKEMLMGRMGQWLKPGDLDAMFLWL